MADAASNQNTTNTDNNNSSSNNNEDDSNTPTSRDFTRSVLQTAALAVKTSNALPQGTDFDFACSFPAFRTRAKSDCANRLVRVMKAIVSLHARSAGADSGGPSSLLGVQYGKVLASNITNADDDDVFEGLVDVVDAMLERVDSCMDEARGVDSKQRLMEQTIKQNTPKTDIRGVRNIPRPQLSFVEPVDNTNTPFVPKTFRGNPAYANLDSNEKIPHPYKHQIETLNFPTENKPREEQKFASIPDTPLQMVQTESQLKALSEDLEKVNEFAIDLEHHNLRSFQGITCLMQISTRTCDYIVDTIALRHLIHDYLAAHFANPAKLKVMHGADFDMQWLARDFDIYVVNLFDTGQAARVLELQSFGLAFLLKEICDVHVDKTYQLADWRIRELPDDMIEYARSDTHYLLFVYDRLHNILLERSDPSRNLLLTTFKNSAAVSLTMYEKDLWTPTSYLKLYKKNNCNFNQKQLAVFAAVFKWRHTVAREEDESTKYVLPNYMLFNIADAMPTQPVHLVSLCSPTPPLVRVYAPDICRLIAAAKAAPEQFLGQPTTTTTTTPSQPQPPNEETPKTTTPTTTTTTTTEETTTAPPPSIISSNNKAKQLQYTIRTAQLSRDQSRVGVAMQSRVKRVQKDSDVTASMTFVADLLAPVKEKSLDPVLVNLAKEIKATMTAIQTLPTFSANTTNDQLMEDAPQSSSEDETNQPAENDTPATTENQIAEKTPTTKTNQNSAAATTTTTTTTTTATTKEDSTKQPSSVIDDEDELGGATSIAEKFGTNLGSIKKRKRNKKSVDPANESSAADTTTATDSAQPDQKKAKADPFDYSANPSTQQRKEHLFDTRDKKRNRDHRAKRHLAPNMKSNVSAQDLGRSSQWHK